DHALGIAQRIDREISLFADPAASECRRDFDVGTAGDAIEPGATTGATEAYTPGRSAFPAQPAESADCRPSAHGDRPHLYDGARCIARVSGGEHPQACAVVWP